MSPASVLKAFVFSAVLLLTGAGCKDAPPPPPPPPPVEAQFDVTKTTCQEIASARAKVAEAYAASIKAAGETYAEARAAFQADLDQCRNGIWKGGPCDKEYEATQVAYHNAWGDISNDQFYKEWKKAKADFEACHAQWENKYEEWAKSNMRKEQDCQEEFQAKVSAASSAYQAAADAAKAKRDADNAFLDELEKKCKEPPTTGGGTGTTGSTGGTVTGGTTTGGTTTGGTTTGTTGTTGGTTTYQPNSRACQDTVPGEDSTPRTGRARDFGPRDILINLATTVAEEVTGTPIPISAISDQIFAGVVVTKLTARLWELQMEEIDAITSGNRAQEIAVRQKIARYRRAIEIWGKIAEGRPALPEIKKDVATVGSMPTGGCKVDTDCGTPVCCSAQEVGTPRCNVSTGACTYEKTQCTDPKVCGGNPAQCVAPPQKVRAINFNGKFLPIDQLIIESEPGCGAAHYHAKLSAVRATDGTTVGDPGPQCGYGKVSERPIVEVMVPSFNIEVRGLEGLR